MKKIGATVTLIFVLGVPFAIANIQTLYSWFPRLKPAIASTIDFVTGYSPRTPRSRHRSLRHRSRERTARGQRAAARARAQPRPGARGGAGGVVGARTGALEPSGGDAQGTRRGYIEKQQGARGGDEFEENPVQLAFFLRHAGGIVGLPRK